LELQRTVDAIAPAPDHDKRGEESEHLKIAGKLRRIPDLPVLLFQSLAATGLSVDLRDKLPARFFSRVSHDGLHLFSQFSLISVD
jgi:hypothetical protein